MVKAAECYQVAFFVICFVAVHMMYTKDLNSAAKAMSSRVLALMFVSPEYVVTEFFRESVLLFVLFFLHLFPPLVTLPGP